jgi:hypothetical protein
LPEQEVTDLSQLDSPFHRDHWPRSISTPDQYDGGDVATINWEGLPAKDGKKAIAAWIEALPTMASVRRLSMWARVPQAVFDAACALDGLEVLQVKVCRFSRLDSLARQSCLQALWLGGTTQADSIEPIARLQSLGWLELGDFKRISDFSPLVRLTNLHTLGVLGSMWSRQDIASLEPFAAMSWLRTLWLDTAGLDSIRPLAALVQLRELGLGGRLPFEEYAWLSAKLPDTKCFRFVPYIDAGNLGLGLCKKCRASKVMLTGRGKPVLCPTCDKAKIDKHVAQWESIRAAAMAT